MMNPKQLGTKPVAGEERAGRADQLRHRGQTLWANLTDEEVDRVLAAITNRPARSSKRAPANREKKNERKLIVDT